METVLVGLDAWPSSPDPIRWANDYCQLKGDELVSVVVYRPSQSELPPDWYDTEVARVRKAAEAVLDVTAPAVPHRLAVRDGDPRAVIAEVADEEGATVVVVGAEGRGGFRGLGVGTVAHQLSHHILVPVVIVPALGRSLVGGTVVVGLDGSSCDVVTLDWAVRLARAARGRVCVVYASDPMAMSYPHPRGATVADQLEVSVREQVDAVEAPGVAIDLVVEVDYPVAALARVADQRDASVVVVGRKGAGHVRGVLLGRVPAQLPFRAQRPVAVVPRQSSD
jgi:nucleotide-binding universal stress UspA family protein